MCFFGGKKPERPKREKGVSFGSRRELFSCQEGGTMERKSLMIQGTASSVGKSLINTALCRIFTQDGWNVNPFKAQNMSLNSYITVKGEEMGRAQVVQAEACKKLPDVDMNPILLKPSSDRRSQIILRGKVHRVMDAYDYFQYKKNLAPAVQKSYESLLLRSDIVILEGAGSPAEINLKENDIVNMGMAKMARSPVLLVGDIDKGGVFASLYGTYLLLEEEERSMVKGFLINKFRGDRKLLEPGLTRLEEMTGVPVLGVVPMLDVQIEEEDSASLRKEKARERETDLDIAVVDLPYLSNFTDINAMKLEPETDVRFVKTGDVLGQPDIILIPGTKNTLEAAIFMETSGLGKAICRQYQNGAFVFGICGGYQLLGRQIWDESQVESAYGTGKGLGLLDVNTYFAPVKKTTLSKGCDSIFHEKIEGYEIHMGHSELLEGSSPFLKTKEGEEGTFRDDGRVIGTYFHGIFDNDRFRRKYLNYVRNCRHKPVCQKPVMEYAAFRQRQYDDLAQKVRDSLDMKRIYEIVRNGL